MTARDSDPLQVLLDLCEEQCEDFLVANDGSTPNVPKWYALGYWRDYNDPSGDGEWEIDVKGASLREALCAFIAHERFGV